ncbi:hypothetical protein GQ43DRAFT_499646 [Delitschia confertaspora ATCC 74209]|uniref:Uncharacterized protein n=1 Tax=Delitschia confertaspora ATCC 74209 TaxID=1513339 RepID=A0A9P4JAW5_9PLEO|nr:hypothetical protein GQ43DRAFT_499646 [Delitschia confertaspora ATCC 74209]
MSSGRNSPPLPSPGATDKRRASLAGQTFQDLFGRSSSISGQQVTTPGPYPGPITSAAVNAQRRRLSLTTIGLSGSPNTPAAFPPSARPRTESLSSANSGSVDESPFEDDPPPSAASSNPTTPFARRLSFGARAMRDVRASNGNIGNANGEGFNFAENLRSRAERTSMSGAHPMLSPPIQHPTQQQHRRAQSAAVMEQPPAREMPKAKVPDAFQERILKGDFYMD